MSNISILYKIMNDYLIPIQREVQFKVSQLIQSIHNRSARTSHRKNWTTIIQCVDLLNMCYTMIIAQLYSIYTVQMDDSGGGDRQDDKMTHSSLMKWLSLCEKFKRHVNEGSVGLFICKYVSFLVALNK